MKDMKIGELEASDEEEMEIEVENEFKHDPDR